MREIVCVYIYIYIYYIVYVHNYVYTMYVQLIIVWVLTTAREIRKIPSASLPASKCEAETPKPNAYMERSRTTIKCIK